MTGERELAPVETLRLYGMSERSAETFIARVKAEAWDEAQRRYPPGDRQAGFVSGAAWADDNPKPRTVTRAEFEEEYTYWFDGSPSRERAFEFLWALGVEVTDDE